MASPSPGFVTGGIPIPRRAALAAFLLVVSLSATTLAAEVPRLESSITDQTGLLEDGTEEIEAALDELLDSHGIQLFVLFVDTTDDLSSTEFADETAQVNSLGADDALLLVALEDHTDAIWVSDSLDITDDELNDVISGTLEPGLRDGDFPQAVIATAVALGLATVPSGPGPQPTGIGPEPTIPVILPPGNGEPAGGDVGLGTLLGIVLLGLGIVVLGVWGVSRFGARLAAWRDSEERDRRTGKLARAANAGLIAMDDRVRTSDQEVGFVEAQFGADEAAPFRDAVLLARDELRGAFEIRQRLDDSEPEDPPTRELMLQDIVERTGRAAAALDAQAARIDELRNLEREAPTILAALPAQVAALEARLPQATDVLRELSSAYAEPAWAAVKGNVAEATKGLTGAQAAIDRGTATVAAGRGVGVAHEIVTAQQGIAGAAALLDAIETTARTIRETEAGLAARLDTAEADLAAARDAQPAEQPEGAPSRDSAFVEARAALRAARNAAAAVPPEPLAAGRATAAAARTANELLATIRADAGQAARFVAAVDASLAAAHAEIDRAEDFIGTRRGGVGRRARTRLAAAQRLLAQAETSRDSDLKQAMADAQRADKLAGEAYSLASLDFARWDRTGRGAASTGSDVAGSILGGIIGGILSGGGRGAGWGGSPWGSPGGGNGGNGGNGGSSGGGGWGGGHSSGGSFGGFGGGGSSGGGGGGGHSQGGRW